MALSAVEIKALLKEKGWSFVDLAARWGVSVTWMSRLVNQPHARPAMYDDAFRGLPHREAAHVVREQRHIRKRREAPRPWTAEEMFPAGRLFEAIDSNVVEEGIRVVSQAVRRRQEGVYIQFMVAEGPAAGDGLELEMEAAQLHFADLGLDHPQA